MPTKPEVKIIEAFELKKRFEADPNLCLVDVRELDEWQTVCIPTALHIPQSELPERITAHVSDLNTPIYLHCKSGKRSFTAAQTLLDSREYKEVYSLEGGIIAWIALNYSVRQGAPCQESQSALKI